MPSAQIYWTSFTILTIVLTSWTNDVKPVLGATMRGWELREALQKLDKELYDNAPGPDRPFIESLRNPCWKATGGTDVHCLPYAMVMGGFHSGAASLWAALNKHPMVAQSDVSRWHFWAEFDKTLAGYTSGLARATSKLLTWQQAAAAAAAAGKSAADGGGGGGAQDVGDPAWLAQQQKIILDGSSSTFAFYWSPNIRAHRTFVNTMMPCWNGCHKDQTSEGPERDACLEKCFGEASAADRKVAASLGLPYNEVSLPLLMSAVYGRRSPKMIVLLRNPVDRLYSAYWRYAHYRDKFGPNAEGFTTYAREQLSGLKACMARNGTESEIGCLLRFETYGLKEERLYFHADQLLRGVYVMYLEVWLKYFDRRDLLIIRSEDYFAHPLRTYTRVLSFLNLDANAITFHSRIERLSKAAAAPEVSSTAVWEALQAPGDDRLWQSIKHMLFEDEPSFTANRLMERAGESQAGGSGGGGGVSQVAPERPDMAADIRQEVAAFYAPYNQRLATLLGDAEFIRGWD